jgi:hypothetical protein
MVVVSSGLKKLGSLGSVNKKVWTILTVAWKLSEAMGLFPIAMGGDYQKH